MEMVTAVWETTRAMDDHTRHMSRSRDDLIQEMFAHGRRHAERFEIFVEFWLRESRKIRLS